MGGEAAYKQLKEFRFWLKSNGKASSTGDVIKFVFLRSLSLPLKGHNADVQDRKQGTSEQGGDRVARGGGRGSDQGGHHGVEKR